MERRPNLFPGVDWRAFRKFGRDTHLGVVDDYYGYYYYYYDGMIQ